MQVTVTTFLRPVLSVTLTSRMFLQNRIQCQEVTLLAQEHCQTTAALGAAAEVHVVVAADVG